MRRVRAPGPTLVHDDESRMAARPQDHDYRSNLLARLYRLRIISPSAVRPVGEDIVVCPQFPIGDRPLRGFGRPPLVARVSGRRVLEGVAAAQGGLTRRRRKAARAHHLVLGSAGPERHATAHWPSAQRSGNAARQPGAIIGPGASCSRPDAGGASAIGTATMNSVMIIAVLIPCSWIRFIATRSAAVATAEHPAASDASVHIKHVVAGGGPWQSRQARAPAAGA